MSNALNIDETKGAIPCRATLDVVIVGAGISGINTAYRLQTELPGLKYTILEARNAIGGTWDFFKYPGLRSDSDLFTFGFPWRPWSRENPIADANSILAYLRLSAATADIDHKIQFNSQVQRANWSTESQTWELTVATGSRMERLYTKFLVIGTGYYDYEQALSAAIPNLSAFTGRVIHPQFWPKDLEYAGKRVVCVGSGATAITLLPVLAQKAASVTMLQRSPSYIVSISNPTTSSWLWRQIPRPLAYRVNRLWFMVFPVIFYLFCRIFPTASRNIIRNGAAKQLPAGYPMSPDFEPRYNPFDQRVCFAPDGDFYTAIRSGRANVVTGTIEKIVHDGIILTSGAKIDADIIVTATGLKLQLGGKINFNVDDRPYCIGEKFMWHNAMLQDLPNAVFMMGYTTASWTLGADVTASMLCRLLKGMRRQGLTSIVPRMSPTESKSVQLRPLFGLSSTYVVAAANVLPKTGDKSPWRRRTTYFGDYIKARYGDLTTGLQFYQGSSVKSHVRL